MVTVGERRSRATRAIQNEGLTYDVVERRREQFGPNELHKAEQRRWLDILVNQFTSGIVLLLAVAGVAAFVLGEYYSVSDSAFLSTVSRRSTAQTPSGATTSGLISSSLIAGKSVTSCETR